MGNYEFARCARCARCGTSLPHLLMASNNLGRIRIGRRKVGSWVSFWCVPAYGSPSEVNHQPCFVAREYYSNFVTKAAKQGSERPWLGDCGRGPPSFISLLFLGKVDAAVEGMRVVYLVDTNRRVRQTCYALFPWCGLGPVLVMLHINRLHGMAWHDPAPYPPLARARQASPN